MWRHELMQRCPRWESCSATVCPADPLWRQVPHLCGERVCGYLLELAKPGGEGRIRSALSSDFVERIREAYAALSADDGDDGAAVCKGAVYIRAKLRRAAETGSRMDAGRRLRASRDGAAGGANAGRSEGFRGASQVGHARRECDVTASANAPHASRLEGVGHGDA